MYRPLLCLITCVLATSLTSPCLAASPELYFGVYVEGSSNNKALGILNRTEAPIDLGAGNCSLELYANGAGTSTATIGLAGTVPVGGIFVIANTAASLELAALAQQLSSSLTFNGDDAIALVHGNIRVDVIGQIGFDPGSAWGAGSVITVDHTLVRKTSVCSGDSNGLDLFDPSAEWDGFAGDTYRPLDHLFADAFEFDFCSS